MKRRNRTTQLMMLAGVCVLMAACGPIPVNVNGKTMYIGGDDKDKAKAAQKNGKTGLQGAALSKSGAAITKKADTVVAIPADDLKPMYKADVKVNGTVLRMSEQGFKDCGSAWGVGKPIAKVTVTTEQVLTIKFKENTPRAEARYQGIMVRLPNDRYICKASTSNGLTKRFAPGEYLVYSAWSGAKTNNHKHPGQPFASTGQLEVYTLGRKTPAPVYTLDKTVANPWYSESFTYTGAYNKAREMGYKKCSSSYPITAAHIAEINVTEPVETTFNIRGTGKVILVNEKGSYWCDTNLSARRKWTPGSYKVYAYANRSVAKAMGVMTFRANHYNVKAAPTMQGEVPVHKLGDLAEPKVMRGTTLGNRYTSASRCGFKNSKLFVSTQPDFYIELEKPLGAVNFKLLDSNKKQMALSIYDMTKSDGLLYRTRQQCSGGYSRSASKNHDHTIRKADGKYAVYIAHPGQKPMNYTLLMTTGGTKVSAFYKLREIPDGLTVEQRLMRNHYPYMGGRSNMGWRESTRIYTWENIDPKLVVYTTKNVTLKPVSNYRRDKKSKKTPEGLTLTPGEPVVVLGVKERRKNGDAYIYNVLTSDLHQITINADALSTTKPKSLVFPKKPREYKSFSWSIKEKTADKRAMAANASYDKSKKRYNTCFDKYWSKHGGSTASKYNRVTRRNGRIVGMKNMGKIIAERADRKCGAKGVDSKKAKLDREMDRSFASKRKSMFKTIGARLNP